MDMHFTLLSVLLLLLANKDVCGQDYKDAVYAARNRVINEPSDTVVFDVEPVDTKDAFDRRGGRFFAPKAGLYWVSLSAGALPNKSVDYYLKKAGMKTEFSLKRPSTNHNGKDTMSRDLIVPMTHLESLSLGTADPLFSDYGLQTSLAIFRITDLMVTQKYYFSAVSNTPSNGTISEIVQFDKVLVNVGDCLKDSILDVPYSGVWFLSYSVGVRASSAIDVVLRKQMLFLSTLERFSTTHRKDDFISRSGMYELKKGDKVFLTINNTSITGAPGGHATSFSGFLYYPTSSLCAWSVAKNTSWAGNLFLYPVPFEEVIVNKGSKGWDQKINAYVAPSRGYYYVTATVGVQPRKPLLVNIMLDGKIKATLVRSANNHNGIDTVSRSIILYMEYDSWVYLAAEANTAIFSNREKQTTFSGFYLFSK